MKTRICLILIGLALSAAVAPAHAQPSFRGATSGSTAASPEFRAASSGAIVAGISFRSAASAATSTATLTVGKPAGTALDDAMIAAIGVQPHTATITPPAGWTLVRRIDNTVSNSNSLAVYRKTAGGSEPASYDWSTSGAAFTVGGIQSFLGVDTANPIDVENGQSTGFSLSHATPSVTTTVANAMLVASHSFATATTWSPPAGMTEGFDVANSGAPSQGGQSIEANWAAQAAAGATGSKTATASGGGSSRDEGNTHILALRPVASPVLTLGKPTGTVANDVMIASIGVRPRTATITPPAGWTLVRRIDNTNAFTNSLAVYRRTADGSEPASYGWSTSGADFMVGGIQSFSGVDPANPIDVENGQLTGYSLSHATPSVTTTVANAMLVTSHTFTTATTWSPPAGMTEGFDVANTSFPVDGGQSIEANWATQAAAGVTGARTATAAGGSSSQDWGNTHILVLRPVASPVLTLGKPSGTVANDVMIASIGVRPSSATITPPSGWTLVRRVDNTTAFTNSLAIYRRTAEASEAASYGWSLGGAEFVVGGIQSFSGVDPVNPVDVESGQITIYSLSHSTPSVTTTVANAMLVTSHTFTTATTWSPPAGMTEGFEAANTSFPVDGGQSIEANWAMQAAAGATGAKTATAAGTTNMQDWGNAHILVLRPGAPPVPKLHFIHTDHLNTPRLIANDVGQVVWSWANDDPFGANVPNENPSSLGNFTCNLRLPGQYFDKETNLHYNYFRDYDPGIGRYIQADPLGVDGLVGLQGLSSRVGGVVEDADGLTADTAVALALGSNPASRSINLYGYVSANPLSWVDPLGLAPYEHHWVPQSVYRNANLPPEAFRVLDRGLSVPLQSHGFDTAHRQYNQASRELWERLLKEGKIDPTKMTASQAEKILEEFKRCPDPRMKPLQRQILNQAIKQSFKRLPPRGE